MKLISPCIGLLFVMASASYAQNNAAAYRKRMMDSIKNVYLTEAAIRNPALRQITVSTDVIASTNIKSQLYGNELFKGKVSQVRTTALFTMPVKSWGRNSVSATAGIFQQHISLSDITPYQATAAQLEGYTTNKVTVGITANYIRLDSLFGRPVVYMATVSGLTSQSNSIQKLSYLAGAIFTLKQTPSVRSSLGFLINIDPSINVPFVPIFTYWRKFNNGLELNVNPPQQVNVRKTLSKNLWASFGTSLAGSVAFFKFTQPGIPQDANYSTIELKTGPGVEYRFAKKFIFGLNAGMLSPIQSRIFERSQKTSEYFINNKVSSTPFVNFTLAVLPFIHN
ncbi:hypothetical protein KHS38_10400 [Mucilaginibacter sp. Bleaf8]|uniref:hypothetical protein n=1 Tax=Mucilaginibacter sp. Bleaf8 TaxID=2834430 RepID=UPI001BCD8715|nr:hypothetical protein [Mucilaginibacter sp. Bleaf8]MBS7564815.1 hypothetical protein [Mucilaginibacter sp. Bleaf8]